jgi:hypothetical protein
MENNNGWLNWLFSFFSPWGRPKYMWIWVKERKEDGTVWSREVKVLNGMTIREMEEKFGKGNFQI